MPIRTLNEIHQTIYDRQGNALAYFAEHEFIYSFSGARIAYVHRSRIWSFPGQQLGWFSDGWLRTLPGLCIGFTDNADRLAGPPQPTRKQLPQKLPKHNARAIGVRRVEPVMPSFPKRWCRAPLKLFLTWLQYDAGQ
jgi:hypothetical protein